MRWPARNVRMIAIESAPDLRGGRLLPRVRVLKFFLYSPRNQSHNSCQPRRRPLNTNSPSSWWKVSISRT